jgi:chromosome segregation ATPase
MNFKTAVLISAFTSVAAAGVLAQPQPAPALTTDDIIHARIAPPASAKTAQGGATQASADGAQADAQLSPAERRARADERAWNEKLREARTRLNDLKRRADQAELEINRLRNAQFDPTRPQAPGESGRINARVAELTAQAKSLRAEARTAEQVVDDLLDEGRARKYEIEGVALEKADGQPSLAGYRKRYAELRTELNDLEARAKVLQLRLNDLFAERRKNEGGDNFFLNRLRAERIETAAELEKTKARIAELTQQIAALRQQAALVGIAPGELQ